MGKTIAMIMAGGRGERMDLLCHVRLKPTLPFAGRFSVIDFTLSNCLYSGIRDLVVLINCQCSHTARYLWTWGPSNATKAFHHRLRWYCPTSYDKPIEALGKVVAG